MTLAAAYRQHADAIAVPVRSYFRVLQNFSLAVRVLRRQVSLKNWPTNFLPVA
jgi:hypothetical protein